MSKHVRKTCQTEQNPDGCTEPYGCMLCNCFYCGQCDGFEGTLPTWCPGDKISDDDQQLIYRATLDFDGEKWINRPNHPWETAGFVPELDQAVNAAVVRLNQKES